MTVAVSSALRPASRWLPGSIKPQVDPTREPRPIGEQLRRAVRRLGADCRCEASGPARAEVRLGTARKIPLAAASADSIVTSPPYYVTYDYLDVQRLTFLAFGWPWPAEEQIGRRYRVSADGVGFSAPPSMEDWYARIYRSEHSVLGRALRAYLQDMRTHFKEATRVLKPGGAVAYAIGNSTRSGRKFDLAAAIGELMEERLLETAHSSHASNPRRVAYSPPAATSRPGNSAPKRRPVSKSTSSTRGSASNRAHRNTRLEDDQHYCSAGARESAFSLRWTPVTRIGRGYLMG